MTVCLQEKARVWGGGVIFVHKKGHVIMERENYPRLELDC